MNSQPRLVIILILTFVVLWTSGCSLSTNNQPTATEFPLRTSTVEFFTSMPYFQNFMSAVQKESYLKECRSKYPKILERKTGFQGIYSGVSTKEEVFAQFGIPTETGNYGENGNEYVYYDSGLRYVYHFYVENNLVSGIGVYSKELTLQNILDVYGCPDVIMATKTWSDHELTAPPNYTHTEFQYLKAGIHMAFTRFPIGYSRYPDMIAFGEPESLEDFLKRFDPETSAVVDLSEAVRK